MYQSENVFLFIHLNPWKYEDPNILAHPLVDACHDHLAGADLKPTLEKRRTNGTERHA